MKFAICLVLTFTFYSLQAQQSLPDSVRDLEPVLIQAYASDRPLIDVAASVGTIGSEALQRFSNTNLLPAINTIPGVRMEERSPGSYRFSIRGSLLRSPFGVRNVKAYWNGLPLTDGGGNTYLNLIDFNSVGLVEVIKGPGGSLYGAGTGGVLLLTTHKMNSTHFEASAVAGSYGLQGWQLNGQFHSSNVNVRAQYAGLRYGGYRDQTAMGRDAFNTDINFQIDGKNSLAATFFYTDLRYETPGGLTKAQFDANPRQARPAAGPNRGAVEQQAEVLNKTPYLGLSYVHDRNEDWSTRIGIFGSHSDFTNPTIRNWEERDETNFGGRAESQYTINAGKRKSKITLGGEYQYFKSPIRVYWNERGVRDTLQTNDRLTSRQMFLFAQAELHLPANFFLTLGGSVSFLEFGFNRSFPSDVNESRNLDPAYSPRIALLNKITPGLSLYASISRGFSPPSIAELYPSRQTFDKNIQAESGTNYEAGVRGSFHDAIEFDLTGYSFQLEDALVIRRDASLPGEPEYFVNAGKTSQRGIEAFVGWSPVRRGNGVVTRLKVWNSYSYNRYTFEKFVQGANDFSGNLLTGVPTTVNSSGMDLTLRKFYINGTFNYVDHIPLNDANTVFAKEYYLLGARIGFMSSFNNRHTLEVFAGIDNALDKKYSLGNDLNAVGDRYFNAAQDRSFYAGLKYRVLR